MRNSGETFDLTDFSSPGPRGKERASGCNFPISAFQKWSRILLFMAVMIPTGKTVLNRPVFANADFASVLTQFDGAFRFVPKKDYLCWSKIEGGEVIRYCFVQNSHGENGSPVSVADSSI